jgi:hypothetical protein
LYAKDAKRFNSDPSQHDGSKTVQLENSKTLQLRKMAALSLPAEVENSEAIERWSTTSET